MFIAIHGKLRSGKGTITSHLEAQYGYKPIKFASGLKAMTRSVLRQAGYPEGVIERCIESDLKEVPLPGLGGHTPRRVMQVIGSEWRRHFAPNVWRDMARNEWQSLMALDEDVAIDDLRMPHELSCVKGDGAVLLMVERPDVEFVMKLEPADLQEVLDLVKDPVVTDETFVKTLMKQFIQDLLPYAPETSYLDDTPLNELEGATLIQATEALRDWDGLMAAVPEGGALKHASEAGLPREDFDFVLQNDGTITDLQDKVDAVVEELRLKHAPPRPTP